MSLGIIRAGLAALPLLLAAGGASAAAPHPMVDEALVEELRAMIEKPVTMITLRAQNVRHQSIDQAEIDRLDQEWRHETESDDKPLIARLMGSPLSSYLVRQKAESLGLLVELFVIDNVGLNVGQSSVTSDYWQGDEAKFLETFAKGAQAVHYGEIEVHEETGSRRMQVSFTLTDPESGSDAPVGAATIEIDLDELESRR